MWRRIPYDKEAIDNEHVELPDWWRPSDYLALFIALFQSIAVPFLILALFFLIISVAVIVLGG